MAFQRIDPPHTVHFRDSDLPWAMAPAPDSADYKGIPLTVVLIDYQSFPSHPLRMPCIRSISHFISPSFRYTACTTCHRIILSPIYRDPQSSPPTKTILSQRSESEVRISTLGVAISCLHTAGGTECTECILFQLDYYRWCGLFCDL